MTFACGVSRRRRRKRAMLPNLCGFKVLQSSHAFGLRSRNTAILQDMSKSRRRAGEPSQRVVCALSIGQALCPVKGTRAFFLPRFAPLRFPFPPRLASRAGSPCRRGRSIVLQEPCQPMPENRNLLKPLRNFFFELLARRQPCETIVKRSTCRYCSENADCPPAM